MSCRTPDTCQLAGIRGGGHLDFLPQRDNLVDSA